MNTTKTTLIAFLLVSVISCKKENNTIRSSIVTDESETDVINNTTSKYPSVWIGTQKWMTKNLAVSRYRNGDIIPQVQDPGQWAATTTGAWCWHNNDSAAGAIYGKLYNWYAVNDPRGLAPTGWHVPTDLEWDTLSTFLGGYLKAGGKLKDTGTLEAGTGLWYAPNTKATNKTGFTALPGDHRNSDGSFSGLNMIGLWWSSTASLADEAWYRSLVCNNGALSRNDYNVRMGFSVRCIRD